ncbi:hypothetical protein SCO11_09860 [Legionella pneumophila serogroup 1]|uniref:hypothetical protein n=1 Tax=Legionella pneumophila TaxID=446 RepID=UPI0007708A8D|nr:hypothetical protein [Legionella pneumophila]MCZ4749223.1 hypothetical protein [Legionella pneumophila]MDW8901167.1 hypothetical protein [Legionella pneumophila]MDW8906020.1 hypothetical protein [Legionella pneumophila]CZP52726.1 Uncharacterised protein [Legionella pneumophila]CZP92981.1 Uncharacterised protein [Legionella pneumophila]
MKINLSLYDIDGCMYHAHTREKPIEKWLIESNQNLFDLQRMLVREESYDLLIVASGSNRQDKFIDEFNSQRSDSSVPAFPIIQSYLASQVDCNVVMDPFFLADLYGEKEAGHSYKAILKEKYLHSQENHAQSAFDESKRSLLYAHAHRVAALHPDSEIVIDFYDDRNDILSGLYDFYNDNPFLLPANVTLRLNQYEGKEVTTYPGIKGDGATDHRYLVNTQKMIIRDLSPVSFEEERETNPIKNEVTPSNYTTASALKEQKLIPDAFEVMAEKKDQKELSQMGKRSMQTKKLAPSEEDKQKYKALCEEFRTKFQSKKPQGADFACYLKQLPSQLKIDFISAMREFFTSNAIAWIFARNVISGETVNDFIRDVHPELLQNFAATLLSYLPPKFSLPFVMVSKDTLLKEMTIKEIAECAPKSYRQRIIDLLNSHTVAEDKVPDQDNQSAQTVSTASLLSSFGLFEPPSSNSAANILTIQERKETCSM